MMMQLQGSCHCGAVRFSVNSRTPYPYMRCYCSICCKTAGGGGYAINIMGQAETLKVEGREHVRVYHALLEDGSRSGGRRHFCGDCGSALWISDPEWPELVHPFASAIDTPLPVAPAHVNILLEFAAPWADRPGGHNDQDFDGFPEESIFEWHRNRNLLVNGDG
jgi:hypothetical protein